MTCQRVELGSVELMGTAEVAELLGVKRQRISQLRKSSIPFPEPVAELRSGPVFCGVAVREFLTNWRRLPGRPPIPRKPIREEGRRMTLDELRAALDKVKHLPGSTEVILQKDAEGNGYSPLSGGCEAMYLAHSTWSGEAYLTPEQLAEKLQNPKLGYDEEDDAAPEGSVRVLILYPVN